MTDRQQTPSCCENCITKTSRSCDVLVLPILLIRFPRDRHVDLYLNYDIYNKPISLVIYIQDPEINVHTFIVIQSVITIFLCLESVGGIRGTLVARWIALSTGRAIDPAPGA